MIRPRGAPLLREQVDVVAVDVEVGHLVVEVGDRRASARLPATASATGAMNQRCSGRTSPSASTAWRDPSKVRDERHLDAVVVEAGHQAALHQDRVVGRIAAEPVKARPAVEIALGRADLAGELVVEEAAAVVEPLRLRRSRCRRSARPGRSPSATAHDVQHRIFAAVVREAVDDVRCRPARRATSRARHGRVALLIAVGSISTRSLAVSRARRACSCRRRAAAAGRTARPPARCTCAVSDRVAGQLRMRCAAGRRGRGRASSTARACAFWPLAGTAASPGPCRSPSSGRDRRASRRNRCRWTTSIRATGAAGGGAASAAAAAPAWRARGSVARARKRRRSRLIARLCSRCGRAPPGERGAAGWPAAAPRAGESRSRSCARPRRR